MTPTLLTTLDVLAAVHRQVLARPVYDLVEVSVTMIRLGGAPRIRLYMAVDGAETRGIARMWYPEVQARILDKEIATVIAWLTDPGAA